MQVYDPWQTLRTATHLTVGIADLAGNKGRFYHRLSTILLDVRLDQCGRRCTLAHELAHHDLGHVQVELPWFARRQEVEADRLASARLIGIRELGEALAAHPADEVLAAEELWVDVATLRARLQHLHPSERHYLRRRLEENATSERAD